MARTIEIPDELAERLDDAGVAEDKARLYALTALSYLADDREVRAWWDGLSEEQRQCERDLLRASQEAAEAGRVSTAEEVVARIRAKYGAGSAA